MTLVFRSPHTRYRAIKITRPSIDLAGTYHCKVSSLMSEEMANAHMLVYSPVTESSFKSRRLPNSKVNVTCSFSGQYQQSRISLTSRVQASSLSPTSSSPGASSTCSRTR